MITLEEAQAIILRKTQVLSTLVVPHAKSLGYALSEDIYASTDVPSFDNSSVDGYGVKIADVDNASNAPVALTLSHTVHAGETTRKQLCSGETFKIMTGAFVPKGVEAIIMREHARERKGRVIICRSAGAGQNIRKQGSEFLKGQSILQQGAIITPPVLGILASLGVTRVTVIRKPTIGLLITGDELISGKEKLSLAKVRDSNSSMLEGILRILGVEKILTIRTKDNAVAIRKAILRLLDNDVLITVGGVSVGDRDLVKDQLEAAGVQRHFWGIDMKPGKPNYFGSHATGKRRTLVFGVPGNPVSAAVSFKKLIEPAIWKMQGAKQTILRMRATLKDTMQPDKHRVEFARGILETKEGNLYVTPVRGQGSGMLGGLAEANVLIKLLPGDSEIAKGSEVEVELLHW